LLYIVSEHVYIMNSVCYDQYYVKIKNLRIPHLFVCVITFEQMRWLQILLLARCQFKLIKVVKYLSCIQFFHIEPRRKFIEF